MKIELFTISYNEEKILPFFLKHYAKFCHAINVYDNMSTDNSLDILRNFKETDVNIISYDTGSKLNDSVYLDIKNNCWKHSTADYVIVVDADEFLYHTDIINFLKNTKKSIYKPVGYDMCSEKFPENDLFNDVTTGVRSVNYDKICIFDPSKIENINYVLGCHQAHPTYTQTVDPIYISNDLKMLHCKNLSFDYRFNKHQEYIQRLSDFNVETGAGIHYTYTREQQYMEFQNILNNSERVI